MKEAKAKVKAIAKTVGGAAVGAITILGWLGITPQMVGEQVCSILYV